MSGEDLVQLLLCSDRTPGTMGLPVFRSQGQLHHSNNIRTLVIRVLLFVANVQATPTVGGGLLALERLME